MNENSVRSILFDHKTYNPDTLNLNDDAEARNYWFNCFGEMIKKFAIQAARSQQTDPTATHRSQKFENDFLKNINLLKDDKNRKEPLTIRTLLELNEYYLRLNGFTDPWNEEKKLENCAALSRLESRLEELDSFKDVNYKWMELIKGLLAGNIFDWGAQAVSEILKSNQKFGLHDALERIESRPWLIDGLDEWLDRLQGPPHKCAAIFVDNSGVDIILGVIPFARELLIRGTKVLLCANTEPSLNDITSKELNEVIGKCCDKCNVIREAVQSKQLLIYGNGQLGPCLDMRSLSPELSNAIETHNADLLVIEGMGRALHTNLYATFKCETLKLAVVKNKWWANRLGGDTFSIICKYEKI